MGFATRSFKIISLISGRTNKKETSHIMIHYVRGLNSRGYTSDRQSRSLTSRPCGIQAPGSHLGRLRPPKPLSGTKCIKMLSPL